MPVRLVDLTSATIESWAANDACKVAGIDNQTIHGLRRSSKSLTEWLEIPPGVVAQVMGQKTQCHG
jgi:integrase